ncbi:ClpP/crotonase-like domain-containing protein [Zychaea mexicana]|uniref:ClpP/crotonase-like domain-containing protein n=1 Tax=Zychaea mexicana TaxID=64656 RepID=UPI0022FE999D|nr:ClpP/crotonase-like domain-containing protein [Zychaea mexicana]KAI9490182.1 ClpP/crotonase-like domain-containing protein [Zychaea mexicana]
MLLGRFLSSAIRTSQLTKVSGMTINSTESSHSATTTAAQRLLAVQKRLVSSSPASKFSHTTIATHHHPVSNKGDGDAEVLTHQHPSGICEILLNRPKNLNAINYTMCDIICERLLTWEKSDACKAIFVRGNGGKAFCAGGDIKALLDLAQEGRNDDITYIFNRQYRKDHLIGSIQKPYIALIDGITMGGGVGLTMNGPFRIATENTVFAMPENSIGLFSDASASFWMPRLDGSLGPYIGLTGKRLRGADVFYAGIATHYVPTKHLDSLESALKELASQSQGSLDQNAINAVIERFSADMEQEAPFSLGGDIYPAINRCFNHETMEEIIAALKNEKVAVDWAKETLDRLSGMSPTSMKISLQLYHTGARLSFIDCMRLEYQLAGKCLAGSEFSEGTRATLVTRTKPNWNPPTLEEADANEIKRHYFDAPLDTSLTPLCEGGNYMEYPHTRYMLPKCSDILDMADKIGNKENTVKYFLEKYNGKQGVRTKVMCVLKM